MEMKICTKCEIEKSLNEFSPDKRNKDGKCSWCKECYKKHYEEHKEEIIVKAKKYRLKNKEKIAIQDKKRYNKHKKECNIRSKKYHLKHKKEIAIQKKKHRELHKEEIAIRGKKYQQDHKVEIAIKKKKYYNKKRKTDIRFKITCNLRTRINHAIKGNTKSLPTMMLIGCEIDYLMYHLQSQFIKGMSWDNHGEWEIDHIRPCSSFDLTKPEEQRKCFNYSNLQPLWAKDNLSKSDKWNI